MTEPSSYEIPEGYAALFKIEGGEADRHQVRAETLACALIGLQKIAYLLGAAQEGVEIGERFKPSRGLAERYSLRCGLGIAGSYAIPLDSGPELNLLPDNPVNLADAIHQVWESVATNSEEILRRFLPSPVIRKRLAREVLQILPKSGSPYRLGFRSRSRAAPVVLTSRSSRVVQEWIQPSHPDGAEMTVTGKLQKIDFDRKVVSILYKPTQKSIDCIYLPEIEDAIVESRAVPIQVTGKFELDADGFPKQLTEVSRIESIDLSPIVLAECPLREGDHLRFLQPLELDVSLDEESGQYMGVEHPSLGIDAFALNRELLMDELEQQIRALWIEYALASDEELDEEAQALKRALLSALEEVPDAEG
jgi:hypothetical protein